MSDKGGSREPSRDYINDYNYNESWEMLAEQQAEFGRAREARLHGEVINNDE